jgi:hypothetical protein
LVKFEPTHQRIRLIERLNHCRNLWPHHFFKSANTMPIGLVKGDAYEFDTGFLNQLPIVEKAMLARDLDPSAFTIAKGPARSALRYRLGSQYFDYTVTIGEDSFTVTYPSDQSFLEFFLARYATAPESGSPRTKLGKPRAANHRLPPSGGLGRWFETRR